MKKLLGTFLACAFSMIAVFGGGLPAVAKAAEGDTATPVAGKSNHILHEDMVTIVDESTNLFTPIASHTEEDYWYNSRKWNGMPSVITVGDNIFVAWQTGGEREPDPNNLNYIVVAASQDGGNSWIDPFIIIDPLDESVQAQVPQFYYNHAGQLYLLFSCSGIGIHAMALHNMDGDLSDVTYEEPFYIGVNNSSFTKPTLLSDGSIMYVSGTVESYAIRSTDDGKSFQRVAQVTSETASSARRFSESTLIEKQDGMLWHLRRLENGSYGGIEQSFSMDKGLNWTTAQASLPSPLTSPGSRFAMQRLASGNLLFVTNASGMGMNRTKMTAYLSTDDGETWPYSLLLDPLQSSYPDFWQGEDGKIYIAFDKDRYGEGGMRLCIVREEDIKAGKYVSEDAQQLITVTKMNTKYADIKTVNGAFPKEATYKVGTELTEILENYSTTITVTDEYGESYEIKGKYRVSGYKKDQVGTYRAYFVADLPSNLKDSFSVLEFDVTLVESGCSSSLVGTGGGLAISAMGVAAAAVLAGTKKNGKRKISKK